MALGLRALPRVRLGWEAAVFIGLVLVALGLRLWELDGRTMHYDESLHVHYAWRLAVGEGYSHSPWMHGPFQVHLTALMFKTFSDSDFTARVAYALVGSGLVAMPYFLRTYIGRTGAIVTSILLALSPSLLYFSRFGRNDILMAFFAIALLILAWRYLNEGKNRYLYLASAVLALSFATKETSYIIVGIFAGAMLLFSIPDIVALMMGKIKLSKMTGAPVFLLLLFTLTLPQWSALVSVFQDVMGMNLANPDPVHGGGVAGQEVGMAVWGPPFVSFPLVNLPMFVNGIVLAGIVAIPTIFALFTVTGRSMARWTLPLAALVAMVYGITFFPEGVVARDFLVSFGILFGALLVSITIGVLWRWKVWLICAGIFYLIWTFLQTSAFGAFVAHHGYCPTDLGGVFNTLCSKLGGVYTGSWQGLGYWLAQQDVQRGEQPMYYHFTLASVYEFLPFLFGTIAIFYYVRKWDLFGVMLGIWGVLTVVAYTLAGEKMPWLLVNMVLPFIFLAGKLIGDMMDRVNWRRVLPSVPAALLVLTPLTLAGGIYLLHQFLENGSVDTVATWGLLACMIVLLLALAYFIHLARPPLGFTLAGLGIGLLLLGFSSYVAFRASYTYDDSRIEMLVFSQGSADVVKMANILGDGVTDATETVRAVDVDYDMWYPMNWYVRQEQKNGTLGFQRYKIENQCESETCHPQHTCNPLEKLPSNRALYLEGFCAGEYSGQLTEYTKTGPFRNLIWFPEYYKRPGASRTNESVDEELIRDFEYVADLVTRRQTWRDAWNYFLFRDLRGDWWGEPTFFAYTTDGPPS